MIIVVDDIEWEFKTSETFFVQNRFFRFLPEKMKRVRRQPNWKLKSDLSYVLNWNEEFFGNSLLKVIGPIEQRCPQKYLNKSMPLAMWQRGRRGLAYLIMVQRTWVWIPARRKLFGQEDCIHSVKIIGRRIWAQQCCTEKLRSLFSTAELKFMKD